MAFFDMPLEQLQAYVPPRNEPNDFDAFWQETLDSARAYPLNATFTPYDAALKLMEVFDVTYNGFGGQPIKGWLILPRQRTGKLPCVVEYVGYGGGRNIPINYLVWASAGYAHLIMDTRGQGSAWSVGDTPDPELEPGNPHFPGFMTRGVLNPRTYYYRRVFTDAVRAVEAARSHEAIDATRIAVTGGSQGGGITLAVAGLVNDLASAMVDVPFLCHYRVAVELIDSAPYNEIARYCQVHRGKIETVYQTLSYFDGLNFATRANAPTLFSVGLMDEICPPRTVYAAYNHYAGAKDIRIYAYNHHEGGGIDHTAEKVKYMRSLWG